MKLTQKCPKCEGREFAVNTEVRQRGHGSRTATVAFAPIVVGSKSVGWFETWMCLGCGYTEFYACGLAGVREVVAQNPEQLRIVDARPKDGPFR